MIRAAVSSAWLVVLWSVFWGRWDSGIAVGGGLLGIGLSLWLTPLRSASRIRPGGAVLLAGWALVATARSTVRTAQTCLTPANRSTSVAEGPLSSGAGWHAAVVGWLLSLTPGTTAVDVDVDGRRVRVVGFGSRSQLEAQIAETDRRVARAEVPTPGTIVEPEDGR